MCERASGGVTLSREDLYRRVWQTPMRHLAAEYGLSDVGLAKICKRHKIPRPGVGYWAKKEFGKAARQTPLPSCSEPSLQSVALSSRSSESTAEPSDQKEERFDDDIEEWLGRARSLPEIEVPRSLRKPHPRVEATRKALQGAKPGYNKYGHVSPRWSEHGKALDVEVTRRNVPRALRFLDALIKAVERVGGRVESEKRRWNSVGTAVYFGQESVAAIRIRELCHQRRIEPKDGDRFSWSTVEYTPAGHLVLDRGPSSYPHCRDSKTGPIEKKINGVIVGWIEKLGRDRIRRREWEEKRRIEREREIERERIREDFERRQRHERERVEKLLADTSAWHKSRMVREYVDVVRQQARGNGAVEESVELIRWVEWALRQADRLDPLRPSPPSVLDEQPPEWR